MTPSREDNGPSWEFVEHRGGYVLTGVPHFYGRIHETEDGWLAHRAGDSSVPAAPFADLDDAKEWVEDWARSHMRWLIETGMNQAADAQRALMETD